MKRKMNDEDCLNWDSISECFGNRMVSIFREYLCLSLEQKDTIWEPQSKVLKVYNNSNIIVNNTFYWTINLGLWVYP